MRCLVAILVFLNACHANGPDAVREHNEIGSAGLNGRIFFGGNGIHALELRDGHIDLLHDSPNYSITSIDKLNVGGAPSLLASAIRLSPSNEREIVLEFSLEQPGRVSELFRGERAVVIGGRFVAYYQSKKLMLVDMLEGLATEAVVSEAAYVLRSQAVPISENSFLYETVGQYGREVRLYDISDGSSIAMPALAECTLFRAIWIAPRNAVLCQGISEAGALSGEFRFQRLDDADDNEQAQFLSGALPVAYIQDLDLLVSIASSLESAGREIPYAIGHILQTGESILLGDGLYLGYNVAYMDYGQF